MMWQQCVTGKRIEYQSAIRPALCSVVSYFPREIVKFGTTKLPLHSKRIKSPKFACVQMGRRKGDRQHYISLMFNSLLLPVGSHGVGVGPKGTYPKDTKAPYKSNMTDASASSADLRRVPRKGESEREFEWLVTTHTLADRLPAWANPTADER